MAGIDMADVDFEGTADTSDVNVGGSVDLTDVDFGDKPKKDPGFFGRIKAGYKSASLGNRIGELAYQQMTIGDPDGKLAEQIKALEAEQKDYDVPDGFAESAGQVLPSIVESTKAGLGLGVKGAIVGASTAAVAGQMGPQAAIPEEVVTVPAAAAMGFTAGTAAGAADFAYKMEAGNAFHEFKNSGIDPEVATYAASGVGAINAMLELAEIKTLAKTIPGLDKILEKGVKETTKKLLKGRVLKDVAMKYAGKHAGFVAMETAQEVAQESTTIAAGELAKYVSNHLEGTNVDPATSREIVARLWDTAKTTAQGMALVGLPGHTTGAVRDVITADTKENTKSSSTPGNPQTEPQADIDVAIGLEDNQTTFKSGATSEDLNAARLEEQSNAVLRAAREAEAEQRQAEQARAKATAEAEAESEQASAQQTQAYQAQVKQNQFIQEVMDRTEDLPGTLTVTSRLIFNLEGNKGTKGSRFAKVVKPVHQALAMPIEDSADYKSLQKIQYQLQDYGFNTKDPLEKVLVGRLDQHLTDRITEVKKAFELDTEKGTRKPGILPSTTDNKPIGRSVWNYGETRQKLQTKQAQRELNTQAGDVGPEMPSPQPVTVQQTINEKDVQREADHRPRPETTAEKAEGAMRRFLDRGEQPVYMGVHKQPYKGGSGAVVPQEAPQSTGPVKLEPGPTKAKTIQEQRIAGQQPAGPVQVREGKFTSEERRALLGAKPIPRNPELRARLESVRSKVAPKETIEPSRPKIIGDPNRTLSGFPETLTKNMKDLDVRDLNQVNEAEKIMLGRVNDSNEFTPFKKKALEKQVTSFFNDVRKRHPKFAKTNAKKVGKFSKQSREAVYDQINQLQGMSKKAAKATVVETADQLPEHLRASKTGDVIEAVWDNDQVYFVAEHISTPKRAIELWLHEQVGHKGLMEIFEGQGADFDQFLDFAYNTIKKNKALFEQVKRDYKVDLEGKTDREQKRLITEEVIARRAEKLNPFTRKRLFQRFLEFINNWVQNIVGYRKAEPTKLTMKDLDQLLEVAKNYIIHGELRDWLEFKEDHQTYKDWAKEVLEKNPKVLTWFDNHKQWTNKVFGDDARLFDVLLGLTSAGSNMKTNTKYAVDAYLYLAGKNDKIGGRFPGNVKKNLELAKEKGEFSGLFKLDEFVRGLLGDEKATTNDMWMHRLLFGKALLNKTSVEAVAKSEWVAKAHKHFLGEDLTTVKTLSNLDSKFSIPENTAARHKLFQLAKELTDETGHTWNPRAVQAALWVKVVAADNKVDLDSIDYDYGHTFMMEGLPSYGGLSPFEYLKTKMGPSEIGKVNEKVNIKPYPRVSKLEKAYLQYLKDRGVKQIDRYSTDVEDKTLVHFSGKVRDVVKGSPLKDEHNSYSERDVGRRKDAHTEEWPYVPYAYFYGPDSVPEVSVRSRPGATAHAKPTKGLRVYDAEADALELRAAARKVVENGRKKNKFYDPDNVFAKMVMDEGFDGFSIPRPNTTWYALFGEQEVLPPVKSTIRMSDVVESVLDVPQELGALDKMSQDRVPAMAREVSEHLKKNYPSIILDKTFNTLARFNGATSGKMEYGLTAEMQGPLPALRAALSDIVGLGKKQRMIFMEYDPSLKDARSEGVEGNRIRFQVKRNLNPDAIQKVIDDLGIQDYNIARTNVGTFIDMFMGPWVEDSQFKLYDQLYESIGQKGSMEQYETFSEGLGDVMAEEADLTKAEANYKRHINEFFGETAGKKIYDEAIKRGSNHAALLNGVGTRSLTGESKEGPAPGRSQGDDLRESKGTPKDPRYSLRSARNIGLRRDEGGVFSHLKRYVLSTKDWFNTSKFLESWVDDLRRVREVESEAGGATPSMSGWKALRLMRSLGSTMGTFMTEGTLKYDPKDNWIKLDSRDGGFMKVFEGMDPELLDKVKMRLLAERVDSLLTAKTLKPEILERIYGDDESGKVIDPRSYTDEILDETRDLTSDPRYAQVKAHLKKYNDSILDLLEKSGVISPEKRTEWQGYATYVPLNRILDDEEVTSSPIYGQAGVVGGAKAFKGSAGYRIGDPLDNLLANYSYLVNQAMKNTAYKKVYAAASKVGAMVHEKIPRSMYMQRKHREDFVVIRTKGKEQYIRVDDARLYHALADMDDTTFTIKALNVAKKWLTAGVTLSPAFRIRNFLRDTMHTWVLMGKVGLGDVLKAAKDVLNEHDDIIELRAMGAAFTGSYYNADTQDAIGNVAKAKIKGHSKLGAFWHGWEKLGVAAENANRLALYRQLKLEGQSEFDAAFEAKDLLDFSSHGSSKLARFLISIVPFMNARLQGLDKLGRQVTGKDRSKMIMRGSAVALASVALHALNMSFDDDDEYKELTNNNRWLYWHFMFGKNRIRVPKPFELGAVFGEFPVQILDAAYRKIAKDDPEAFKDLWAFSLFTLTETLSLNPLGQGQVLVEQMANKDFFRGRPIVDIGLDRLDPWAQWDHTSSKFARDLGKALNWSPKRIDHVVDNLFSFAGQAGLAGYDHVVAPWVDNYPEDPAMTADSLYWLHGRIINGKSQYIKQEQEFWEMLSKVDQAAATFNKLKKLDRGEARGYRDEHQAAIKMQPMFARMRDKLTDLKQQERLVYQDRKLSPDEKRQKLDDIVSKRHEIILKHLSKLKERYYKWNQ